MRTIRTLSICAAVAVALIALAVRPSHATMCFSGTEPVIAKPVLGTGNFPFQIPYSPTVGSTHWLLVDDYEEPNSGSILTGFINTSTSGTAKQELFTVATGEYEVNPGEQFSSCTIKAHMLSNNSTVPATAYLVVKVGTTQDDGSAITVTGGYLVEYERVMATNPVTSSPWTTDDVLGTVQVGIKNTANAITGNGVGYADIAFICN